MIQRTLTLFSLWTAVILTLELAGFTKSAHLQPLPQSTLSLTQVTQADIATLTQQVTVVINGQNPGSGVIIGKQGNTYTVLTANHVVASPDEYQIVTTDGDSFGRLIGIHGRAEGQAIYNPDTGDTVEIKSGFNLGIPLDTFIESLEAVDSTVLSTNPSFAYPPK